MNTTIKKLRTNSKEVKDKVQAYLLTCINTEEFEEHDGTLKTSLEIVCSEFKRVACFENNLKRLKTYQVCFIDWLNGLPTCLEVEYYTNEIMKLMESWGLPLPADKTEMEGEELFRYLIFREFIVICHKNKVNFWSYCNTNA